MMCVCFTKRYVSSPSLSIPSTCLFQACSCNSSLDLRCFACSLFLSCFLLLFMSSLVFFFRRVSSWFNLALNFQTPYSSPNLLLWTPRPKQCSVNLLPSTHFRTGPVLDPATWLREPSRPQKGWGHLFESCRHFSRTARAARSRPFSCVRYLGQGTGAWETVICFHFLVRFRSCRYDLKSPYCL